MKRTMHGSAVSVNSKASSYHSCECSTVDPTSIDLAVSFDDDEGYYRGLESVPVIGSVHSLETFSSNDGPGKNANELFFILNVP